MPPLKMKGVARPKNTRKVIGRLLRYIGRYKRLLLVVLFAVILSSCANVACDSLLKPAINDYIIPLFKRASSGESITFADFIPFLKLIGIMALIFVLGAFASWVNARLMMFISTHTLYRIRKDLFDELEKLPLVYYDGHTHGELMSLFTNDTDTLRDMMSQSVPQLFSSVISLIAVFTMMIIVSPFLTLVMVISMFFIMLISAVLGKRSANAFREQQKSLGKLNGYIEEMIEGQKVVKVFNREKIIKAHFEELNNELCTAGIRANTFANILMPIMGNLSHVQYAIVAIIGAVRVISGHLDLGSIAAFLQYTRSFSRPITMMSQQVNGVLNALAGAERIFAVIDEKDEIDEGTVTLVNAVETHSLSSMDGRSHVVQSFATTGKWAWKMPDGKLVDLRGEVEFREVSFSYVPEKEVLHNVSLHAYPGEKIALVGSTGSGKTTIINLITRFYDIEDGLGSITYDGIPLKHIAKDDLRRSLSMVLQDTHLFTGSIRDNIRYGNLEASDAQVIEAAKLANADSFIQHLEHGYDTVITADGGNLSQGQRQLLAIARAAVSNPPVLILDEATSSIDTRTEALIEKGMNSLMEGRTVFVIAHRLSTVRNADEIIVLEKGSVVERGNHEQLMKKKGRYYDLYTGAFELD
ncbi:MAG: ABC transporter ATP-binding protein/permease [Treponema sp.]|nr:ABC transporter ATP-binding protein/permease [Treponema sp.]